jgi:tetratricopeptide (TPR) repeat protein
MDGEYDVAEEAAKELEADAHSVFANTSLAEELTVNVYLVPLRFARWDDVLALAPPDKAQKALNFFWHYARGCAYAAKGQLPEAETDRDAMERAYQNLPAGPAFGMMPYDWRTAHDLTANALNARIASARENFAAAIELWRSAVATEDQLGYHEPPAWYSPMRESLGATLLRSGQPAEAEKVFRDDLDRNPRNARSLFGLWKTLEAEQKTAEADWVRRASELAWKGGESQLRFEDF